MIRTRLSRVPGHLGARVLIAAGVALGVLSCAGPQPLDVAINQPDEDAYRAHLSASAGNAASAYANWMAEERGTTAAKVLNADEQLSTTRNPFDAYRDPEAVSRGAVLYKLHCADCHADDARGRGPRMPADYPAPDFRTFGKRFASTLHRGAPKKWFRVIRDGSGEDSRDTGSGRAEMPAFGHALTREQIWLVITYLQSLDVHAQRRTG